MRTLNTEELAHVAGGWAVGVNIQNGNTQNGNQSGNASGKKSTVNNNFPSQVFQNTNINAAGSATDSSNSGTIVNI